VPDVLSTHTRSDRSLLAVSVACFAVSGVATGTTDAIVPTLGGTAIAILGVYTLARYASVVSKRTLALAALSAWLSFLAVAGVHVIGPAAIGDVAPGPVGAVVLTLDAVTWATLLSACGTTTFLGFREYGSQAGCETPEEQVLDGETTSDY